MLQFLIGTDFPFMKYRRIAYFLSGSLILATAIWLVVHSGPRYSVDFTGGTVLRVRSDKPVPADQLRSAIDLAGYHGAELQQLAGATAPEYLIRMQKQNSGDPFQPIQKAVADGSGARLELLSADAVGPKVGSELRKKAIWAVIGSLGWILVYVGFRYEFKFALGAVMALFHDVFITLGVLCFANREISLTVVAALLTIAGYSINDTIVVFDRIRERGKALRKERHSRVMDMAVNETLSRTVITALTVFFTAVALFVWGGEVLRDFSLAMVVGIAFGTYSSVYVASALALDTWIALDRRKGVQAE
jgi:preprotein translocase SecF subunit